MERVEEEMEDLFQELEQVEYGTIEYRMVLIKMSLLEEAIELKGE